MKKAAMPNPTSRKSKAVLEIERKVLGLCSSCNAFKDCTYPRDPKRPILECEEFDGAQPSLITASPLKVAPKEKSVGSGLDEPDRYGGLCKICENRTACTYPKPEGGVWHCEEYR